MTKAMAHQFADLRRRRADDAADDALLAEPIERLYLAILAYSLSSEESQALQARLGLRQETQRVLRGMSRLHRYIARLSDPAARPSQIVQILDEVEPVCLALFPVLCADDVALENVRRYRTEWQCIQPELNGDDLRRMGIPRGVIYRNMLMALRMGRIDGELHSRADEIALVEQMSAIK
jgi:tRNA nucleotidyltransferase (CCA-adding enzyme)